MTPLPFFTERQTDFSQKGKQKGKMDTIARTIYNKFSTAPGVGRKEEILLWLALTDFDEIYQDEILAAADEIQLLRTNLAAALDRLTSADRRIDELLAETDAREAECTRLKRQLLHDIQAQMNKYTASALTDAPTTGLSSPNKPESSE